MNLSKLQLIITPLFGLVLVAVGVNSLIKAKKKEKENQKDTLSGDKK